MNALLDLIHRGGPTVVAIMVLAFVLYARCFIVLLGLRRSGVLRATEGLPAGRRIAEVQRQQAELRDGFRQDRVTLGAMIAAAPLLGLLGTVSGMVTTFESLSSRTDQSSMANLAGGISEVLAATQSGLAVALPGMVFVYLAHRLLVKRLDELNALESSLRGGSAS